MADGECLSEVCDRWSRTCIAQDLVIYVDTSGDDAGACTRTERCRTIGRSYLELDVDRRWIHLSPQDGVFVESVVLDNIPANVHTVLHGAAAIRGKEPDTSVVEVNQGSVVEFQGLTITGARKGSTSTAFGIQCRNTSTIRLVEVTVSDNDNEGVHARECLSAEIFRSRMTANRETGVRIEATPFLIVSAIIDRNAGTNTGGLYVENTAGQASRLFLTTIVNNSAYKDSAHGQGVGGVDCKPGTEPLDAFGNIVHLNTADENLANEDSLCVFHDSVVEGPGDSSSNIDTDEPVFAASGLYELSGISAGLDKNGLAEAVSLRLDAEHLELDVDGTARQVGDEMDCGAQERP